MSSGDRKRITWESLREFLRISSPEQLIEVFLLSAEDAEAWSVLRDILLLMRLKVPNEQALEPERQALERLYLLTRFVEIHKRFPNQEEEGLLFQQSGLLVTMTTVLRSRMSSVRERLLRRLDLKRKWKGSIGIGIDRYPREGIVPVDEKPPVSEEHSADDDFP